MAPSGSTHLSQHENNSIHITKFHAACSIHVSPPHKVSSYLFHSRLTSSQSFTLLVQFTSHLLTKFHATCSIHVSPPHKVSRHLLHSCLTSSQSFTPLAPFMSHLLTKFHATCSIHVSPPHKVARYLFNSRLTSSPNFMLFIIRCTVNFDLRESHPTLFIIRYHSLTRRHTGLARDIPVK